MSDDQNGHDGSHGIIEPIVDITVYCTGIANVHVAQGLIHTLYYVEQPNAAGGIDKVANLRMIMPVDSIRELRRVVDKAIREWRKMDS